MVSVASAVEAGAPVRRYCSGTWGDMERCRADVGRCAEMWGDDTAWAHGEIWGRYGGDMGEMWGDVGTCSVTERSSRVSATTALLRALPFCSPSALLIW